MQSRHLDFVRGFCLFLIAIGFENIADSIGNGVSVYHSAFV